MATKTLTSYFTTETIMPNDDHHVQSRITRDTYVHACMHMHFSSCSVYHDLDTYQSLQARVCVWGSFVVALHGSNATFDDQPCVVLFSRSQCKLPHHQVIQPGHEILDPYV